MSEVSCKDRFDFMNQDELKQAVARAAIDHLVDGAVVGVGETVSQFRFGLIIFLLIFSILTP